MIQRMKMKQIWIAFIAALLFSGSVAAQGNYIKHTVEKGETITQIAKKYKVTPYDIYKLNPDAQNGVQEKAVLLIPSKSLKKQDAKPEVIEASSKVANKVHVVEPKETFYSISKKYKVSVEDLKKVNADANRDGLKIGQELIIPLNGTAVADKKEVKKEPKKEVKEVKDEAPKSGKYLYHIVKPQETKYSIAKEYGMSLQQLEELNPEVKDTLPVGFNLKLDKKAAVEKEKEVAKVEVASTTEGLKEYEVQPKETIYSLSKTFGIEEDKLIALNPELRDGLKIGMIIKVPASVAEVAKKDKEYKDLTTKITNKDKKEMVLLLPFNISKIEDDSENSIQDRLKTNKFLNMTLDFYSGALMAIDSMKKLNGNVNIRIFDSKETKTGSDVPNIIKSNNFSNTDVVVGPFFQSNVEVTAALLEKNDIPVVSPMSKESGKMYSNLFQSMPAPEYVKKAMLDFLKSKNDNVFTIIDSKRGSSKQFINSNYSGMRFLEPDAKGLVAPESIRGMLVKDKTNYIVLETERGATILDVTNTLLKEMENYTIKLVLLEKTEAYDFDEISSSRLMKLNLHYPSLSKDNDSPAVNNFFKEYKRQNNVFPNQYAVRGFDVTFDVLVRLSQRNKFEETVESTATEQIESKYKYSKNPSGGYSNKGVYILYYDTDLTVKEAK
ncbi:hypothetical protein FK004_10610 [Flavobacterium kingsejongi]|uniref:LysM domain-containing protein n=2 Tax=Flavobacterium kingsejongi TaxID=1678728 RepID=A0A2S1LPM6_9FLAO|nr:hypothetical protein FK004_10610 [Flavobacterium kingsejongi]